MHKNKIQNVSVTEAGEFISSSSRAFVFSAIDVQWTAVKWQWTVKRDCRTLASQVRRRQRLVLDQCLPHKYTDMRRSHYAWNPLFPTSCFSSISFIGCLCSLKIEVMSIKQRARNIQVWICMVEVQTWRCQGPLPRTDPFSCCESRQMKKPLFFWTDWGLTLSQNAWTAEAKSRICLILLKLQMHHIVLLPEWEGIRATPDTETLENNCGPETTIICNILTSCNSI